MDKFIFCIIPSLCIIFILFLSFFVITKGYAVIKDSIFATVGDKAITKSDIINEIKIILILNGKIYSEEIKGQLDKTAIQSVLKRTVKKIEVEKHDKLKFNQEDINHNQKCRDLYELQDNPWMLEVFSNKKSSSYDKFLKKAIQKNKKLTKQIQKKSRKSRKLKKPRRTKKTRRKKRTKRKGRKKRKTKRQTKQKRKRRSKR